MGADSDMIKGALLAFEAGSPLDEADRALRAAAHLYSRSKTTLGKNRARAELRRAAILFVAAAQDATKGGR